MHEAAKAPLDRTCQFRERKQASMMYQFHKNCSASEFVTFSAPDSHAANSGFKHTDSLQSFGPMPPPMSNPPLPPALMVGLLVEAVAEAELVVIEPNEDMVMVLMSIVVLKLAKTVEISRKWRQEFSKSI